MSINSLTEEEVNFKKRMEDLIDKEGVLNPSQERMLGEIYRKINKGNQK